MWTAASRAFAAAALLTRLTMSALPAMTWPTEAKISRATGTSPAGRLSIAVAVDQWRGLIDEGVEHLHVYTLNNPDLSFEICRALGYEASPLAASGAA